MKKCSACSHEISDNTNFCPFCGAKIVEKTVPIEETVPTESPTTNNETILNKEESVEEVSTQTIESFTEEKVHSPQPQANDMNVPEIKNTITEMNTQEATSPVINQMQSTTNLSNNKEKQSIDMLLNNKKQLAAFILSALSALFALIYLLKMSPSDFVLIYIMLLVSGCTLISIYNYQVVKKNTNLLAIGMYALIACFLIRICQAGNNHGIEAMIRYMGLGFGTLFLHNHIFSNKNNKTLAYILLAIGGLDAIYLFFSLGNTIITGYTWRLFLLAECIYAVSLICLPLDINKDNLNSNITNINNKLNPILIIIAAIALAIILYFVNGKEDTNYNPFNGNNSSSTVEDRSDNSSYEKEDETPQIKSINITKNNKTTVKTEYRGSEYEAEISLDSLYTIKKVTPPNPTQSYYTYYEAPEGKKFLVAILNVKNTGAETIDSHRLFANFLGDNCTATAIFDGKYKYTTGTILGLEKNNRNQYDLETYYYIDALENVKLYVLYEIAEEVSNKTVTVNACFGDINLNIINTDA